MRHTRRLEPITARLSALVAAAVVATAVVPVSAALADQPRDLVTADGDAANATAPAVVPALTNWEPGAGTWSLTDQTRIVGPAEFAPSAHLLAQEIATYRHGEPAEYVTEGAAGARDIKITIDSSRTDLGKEGYDLTISKDGISIVAAANNGAFYGTRTVSQLLRADNEIPAGHTIDKPKFAERGLTISSFEMNLTNEWIDRVLVEMADLKMNQVLLQVSMKSDTDPSQNSWSYYTKDDIRGFIEKAEAYGIEVIPEVNAPGHISTTIQGYPEFWLVDDHGNRNNSQLDVCNPEAVQFYLDVMDEYIDTFQPKQWNVGADEYMINKDPGNYTRLIDCVRERYGDDAVIEGKPEVTINNAVYDFVNTVNAHAKKRGLNNIRMWNDGIHRGTKVKLDSDIVIEHWVSEAEKPDQMTPQELVEAGHPVQNATARFYDIRWAGGGKTIDTERLWNEDWNVGVFFDQPQMDLDNPLLRGGKVSIWPDYFYAQTENDQEDRLREGLAMMAQMTWTASKDGKSYQQFKSAVDGLQRSPQWRNIDDTALAEGQYRLKLQRDNAQVLNGNHALAGGEGSWTLMPTSDRYYQLKDNRSGRCLALNDGHVQEQGVVVVVGATPSLEACGHQDAEETNRQMWQMLRYSDGSFEIRHALSGMTLAVATGQERDPQAPDREAVMPSGRLGQLPPDLTDDRWLVEPLGDTPQPAPSVSQLPSPPAADRPSAVPADPSAEPGADPGQPTAQPTDPTTAPTEATPVPSPEDTSAQRHVSISEWLIRAWSLVFFWGRN